MKAKTREEVCSLCAGRGFEQTITLSVVICRQCHGLGLVKITSVTPIDPLALGADFFTGHNFDELARLQGVEPIYDIAVLAGGWPDDEEPDEMLAEIYQQRS